MLGVLAQVKAEKDSVDALMQPVETADRLFQELHALNKQVNELEGKLDVQAQGTKSLEEIISELKVLERKKSVIFFISYSVYKFCFAIVLHFWSYELIMFSHLVK